jgi:hypothetical protein
MKILLSALLAACALGWASVAWAAGSTPLVLPAPPPPGLPASSTIRDAMSAIERAEATNPTAAQNAAFSYNAAIQQFNAHQFERARASALTAISQSSAPVSSSAPAAHNLIPQSTFPGPRYYVIPYELPATPANASQYLASAHRAMANCPASKTAAAEYREAVSALSAKNYRAAMAQSRNAVDDCAGQ